MTQFNVRIAVPSSHPSLPGHFPGRPVAPGVVLLDAILAAIQAKLAQPTRLRAIVSAKFHRPIAAAEALEIGVRILAGPQPQTLSARFQTEDATPAIEGNLLLELCAPQARGD